MLGLIQTLFKNFSSLTDLANFIRKADEGLMQNVEEGDYEALVSVMGYLMNVKDRQLVTDDMFEPIRQTIEVLKAYDQELSEEVNVFLQVRYFLLQLRLPHNRSVSQLIGTSRF